MVGCQAPMSFKERNAVHKKQVDEKYKLLEAQPMTSMERVHCGIKRMGERQQLNIFRYGGFAVLYAIVMAVCWIYPWSSQPELAEPSRRLAWGEDVGQTPVEFDLPWLRNNSRQLTQLSCETDKKKCDFTRGPKGGKLYEGSCIDEAVLKRDDVDPKRAGCLYGCLSPEDFDDKRRASVYFMSGDWRLTSLDCNSVLFSGRNKQCIRGTQENKEGGVEAQSSCAEICLKAKYMYFLPFYIIGMLYMFCGLAIVCDEFFVPSLENFVETLGISNDVAGATFMAAGGSMPELITSFQGTFYENDVGFSAIVGSAVFNVLFVIGVCGISSTEVLHLSGWPLGRDVSCYLLTLGTVAFVFKGNSPGEIEAWEAALLLGEYILYCLFMTQNKKIQKKVYGILGKEFVDPDEDDDAAPAGAITLYGGEGGEKQKKADEHVLKPTTFRQGIFTLLTHNKPLHETTGIHAVTMIRGNLEETYKQMDADNDGFLDEEEIMNLLSKLGLRSNDAEAKNVAQELRMIAPRTKDGRVAFEAFRKWYEASEARVEIEVSRVFKKFDKNNSGTIERDEIHGLLVSLKHNPTEQDVDNAIAEILGNASAESDAVKPLKEDPDPVPQGEVHIDFEKFQKWYNHSMFWKEQHAGHECQADIEEEGYSIDMPCEWPPKSASEWSATAYWFVLYPLAAAMYVSIPDCRTPAYNNFKWSVIEFIIALIWIAALSIMLYEWTCIVSNTVGVPTNIAAVTLLAGGTSIPDLLSSYVVAKQGHGDMAVSSSIGSNIFDVTVGLPLPWLIFSLSKGKSVIVSSNSLFFSLIVLMSMLALVILSIMAMGWKMNKQLGGIMMVLYVLYLIQHFLVDFEVIKIGIG